MTPQNRRPFPAASLLALLLIGLAWVYLVGSEVPRGQVRGITVLSDADGKPISQCDVYLTPADSPSEARGLFGNDLTERKDPRERRHTVTDRSGHFSLRGVPAGNYTLSASVRRHSTSNVTVDIEEGKVVQKTLKLARSEPALSIGDHQATFATAEKPFLPVRGYAPLPSAPGKTAMLSVKIWRTRLSEVLKRSDAAHDLDQLRATYNGNQATLSKPLLHPAPGEAETPRLVADTTLPITSVDREGFFVNRLPLQPAQGKPGLYLVKFSNGKQASCSYVLVTDLGLVVKRSARQVIGYAARLQKGTAVAGATLRVIRKGATLASGTTNADGVSNLSISLPKEEGGDDAPLLTMVSYQDDEAVVNGFGYGSSDGDESAGAYAVHTVMDRTVYRPGDTIQYKGIVRQHRDLPDAAPAYTVPRGLPVVVELRDASGALVSRESKTTSASGSFWGSSDTSSEGATGTYTMTTTVAGEQHTAEIKIASYRKPEFAVTVTPGKARYVRGEPVELTLNASYYFGAPVAGAKVHYYVYRDADWRAEYGALSDDEDDSDDYATYRGESYGAYYGESVGEGEINLDQNGKAVVHVRTDVRHPQSSEDEDEADKEKQKAADNAPLPQSETYTLTATVEDDAKRSVEAEGAATVGAGNLLLSVTPEGYVATPGKASQVIVTVRTPDGKPVPSTAVTLAPTYDEWNKDKKESTARPLGAPQTQTTGADGRAVFAVTPRRTSEIRLVATARDDGNRTVRAEGSLWAASDHDDNLDTDYSDLSLLTDKRQYAPGDTARILVNTSRIGQSVLLSVEGDQVYQTFSLPVRKHSTVVQLPIKAAWGPNVVLVANYVRDKKFASSETPLRVSLAARKLTVDVRPVGGTQYRPGGTVIYNITTRDAETGKPVSTDFALSVVDESIYALRADNPKALHRTFYPQRSHRVNTTYSFSVEYLGDVNKAEPKIQARRRFRDTAFWQPNGRTDADGTATIQTVLPDNLTTWRATVNAVSDETAVGYGITKVISSKPFFVRLETPRFLTGGDMSRLLALVHNETGKAQQVQVRLQASTLQLSADETQSLTVPAGSVGQVQWSVTAPANFSGSAPLRVTAWTPQETGKEQFTDGVEQSLPVTAYGRTRINTFAGALEPYIRASAASDKPGDLPLQLDATAIVPQTRLTLRITPSVQGALGSGIEYLVGFPYGCTEQTMSRFYPDLLVQQAGLLKDSTKQKDLPRMVRDGLARLGRFQHSESGGWGWWETDKDDAFLTAYVLVGLSAAKAQGYPVDDGMIERGTKAGVQLVGDAPLRKRPFLLYALSEAGYDPASTVLHAPYRDAKLRNQLAPAKLPTDALAYLCLLGQRLNEDYRPYFHELEQRAVFEGRLTHWSPNGSKPDEPDFDCSDRMATALAVRVLLMKDPAHPRIPGALRWLMQSRTDGYFGNTRDTSWVLVALCDYLKAHPEEAAPPSGTLSVQINNQTIKTVDLARDAQGEPEIVLSLPTRALRSGQNHLRLVRGNATGGTVFYSAALRQTLGATANTDLPPLSDSGVVVKREVLRLQPHKAGDNLWQLATEPVENGRFAQGDRLRVRLVITTEKDASYVLIEDRFPSGAEVTQRGTAEEEVGEGGDWNFWYDHVDVRDDRIAFFARKLPKGKHVLEYNLRAQTPGTSRALPTVVQGMYDNNTRGESGVTPLEVQP